LVRAAVRTNARTTIGRSAAAVLAKAIVESPMRASTLRLCRDLFVERRSYARIALKCWSVSTT
jgi:hypothetical protein